MQERLLKLLEKYNVPGPRYTSYPTVPVWRAGVGPEAFRRSLKALPPGETLSLYFHLPFCEQLCHFCGCMRVITRDHSRSRPYLDTLLMELNGIADQLPGGTREVSQVHLGGGTPNFLQPEELLELVAAIHRRFRLQDGAELAIEMHPRTSTPAFCEALAKAGFNRISLGVQDFDPTVQSLINRHQTYQMTADMVELLRGLGFRSFNFDLIYGLPGQTASGWQRTLERVLELRPNRLAVYSYAHVPWKSPVQRSFADADLPSPRSKLELFQAAYQAFTGSGYRAIGMDHFALEDDELSLALERGGLHRNFMGYSTRADAHQLGFGVSAISYVAGNYFQNEKELADYDTAIRHGGLATHRGFLLDRDDAIRRDLITRIMCHGSVNISEFEKKWELEFRNYFTGSFDALISMSEDGLLEIKPEALKIRGEGFLFLRNVAMAFDRYLEGIQSNATHPTFSKTV
jgi:oxygen-independent coproporphyrinogen III oxidase